MPLVLFSGGLDSTVALYWAIANAKKEPVYALSFHYGQRHLRELLQADRITQMRLGSIKEHRIVVIPPALMPNKASILGGGIPVQKYDHIPKHEEGKDDPAFIPHRNLLFLTIGATYARAWGLHTMVTGLRGGFPDCTMHFELAVDDLLNQSDPDYELTVCSPCHGSRAETIGLAYSLPGCWQALAYSLTCFEGTEPPCGKCLPCLKRAEGFAQFGKDDPLLERLRAENVLVEGVP